MIAIGIFAGTVFCLAECDRNRNPDPVKSAEESNNAKFDKAGEEDAQYVVNAYSDGLFEIRMAERIKDRASTSDVKELANSMITSHSKLNDDLAALAQRKQISLPQDLTAAQQSEIDRIAEKSGRDVDVAYVDKLVSMHKDAISLFEKVSANGNDPEIRTQFNAALPELRHHVDMAMNVQDRLKK
jgi:putative membrane protein